MGDIRIKVGASLDRSVGVVFGELAAAAKRARVQVETELKAMGKAMGGAYKQGEAVAKTSAKATAAEVKKTAKDNSTVVKEEKKKEAQAEKEFAALKKQLDREAHNDFAKMQREMTRTQKREIAERTRAQKAAAASEVREAKKSARERAHLLKHVGVSIGLGHSIRMGGSGALGIGLGLGREAFGLGSDVARSMGYNMDMGDHLHNVASLEELSAKVSNEGFLPSDPRNAFRVDPGKLQEESLSTGKATGFSGNEVMEGLQEFVGKTGDLSTARDVMKDLAKLSKATGSNLTDMVGAAADVSNQLGDMDDKGKVVKQVMMQIAGEGKLGAVPMRAMASQMAKIASAASQMEGDRAKNIGLFGAIAQEARLHGGAASAGQAATSITALMSVFGKGARLDAFKGLGVETYNRNEGKVRNIQDIIVQTLQKTQRFSTGANPAGAHQAFIGAFGSVQAARAVGGFENIYRSTFAQTKGTDQQKLAAATKAVNDEFERLTNVTVQQEELNTSFAAAMSTAQSKAKTFNTELDETALAMKNGLQPALEALAPILVDVAKDFGKLMKSLGFGNTDANAQGDLAKAGKDIKISQGIVGDLAHQTGGHWAGVGKSRHWVKGTQSQFTNEDVGKSQKVLDSDRKRLLEQRELLQKEIGEEKAKAGGLFTSEDDARASGRTVASAQGQISAINREISDIDKQKKDLGDAFVAAMEKGTMKVVVVEDKSKTPPGAAVPPANGTSGEPAGG